MLHIDQNTHNYQDLVSLRYTENLNFFQIPQFLICLSEVDFHLNVHRISDVGMTNDFCVSLLTHISQATINLIHFIV